MKTFVKLVLSENGMPSSKRVILFILLLAFLAELFINLFTAKAPISELREELFYALTGALATVFGSNILSTWKDIKSVQSDNNAKVGAPSPQIPTTETTNIVKQ